MGTYPGDFQIGASTSEMAVLGHIRPCLHNQYTWHIRIKELQYAASTVLTLFNDMSGSRPPLPLTAPIGGITAPAETSHVAPLGATIASVPGHDSYSSSGLIRA